MIYLFIFFPPGCVSRSFHPGFKPSIENLRSLSFVRLGIHGFCCSVLIRAIIASINGENKETTWNEDVKLNFSAVGCVAEDYNRTMTPEEGTANEHCGGRSRASAACASIQKLKFVTNGVLFYFFLRICLMCQTLRWKTCKMKLMWGSFRLDELSRNYCVIVWIRMLGLYSTFIS